MTETILVVDDEPGCRDGLRRLLQAWGYRADTAATAEEALERYRANRPDAVLTDLVLPGIDGIELVRRIRSEGQTPIVVLSGQGSIEQAVEAIKLGALDFLEKPVEPSRLAVVLERLAERGKVVAETRRMRTVGDERGEFGLLRGLSPAMLDVYDQIEKVAPSPLSVLIVGESGTGKELAARTVHERSTRRNGPFVPVNCAAIPGSLLESEIFGHERGAFTGAHARKIGCFETADGGTLFLDEISEMEPGLQAKLLRVLQDQRFRRLGGAETIEADVRVVAATNRDPRRAIADGRIREDLYYRLAAFTLRLPPLRDRPEDIPFLAKLLADGFAERHGSGTVQYDPVALDRLRAHDWPGNVRELKNCVEQAVVLAGSGTIRPEHLPPEVVRPAGSAVSSRGNGDEAALDVRVGNSMEEIEKEVIASTLRHTGGNKTRAARILGVSIKTMHNKVKKYGL